MSQPKVCLYLQLFPDLHMHLCIFGGGILEYPEPGPAAVLQVPPAFHCARFCRAEDRFCVG